MSWEADSTWIEASKKLVKRDSIEAKLRRPKQNGNGEQMRKESEVKELSKILSTIPVSLLSLYNDFLDKVLG